MAVRPRESVNSCVAEACDALTAAEEAAAEEAAEEAPQAHRESSRATAIREESIFFIGSPFIDRYIFI